jgi:glycerophosphoryl diester phosphodiesterase
MQKPLVIGHRGASALAPENTLASFERAIADGADGIEFDVRLSRDGVPVVIHDPDLWRTGSRKRTVRELTSDELARVDVGSWFNRKHPALSNERYSAATVPGLVDVFDLMSGTSLRLYVEIKCERDERRQLAEAVSDLLLAYDMLDRAVVESFDLEAIKTIKEVDNRISTAALFEPRFSHPFLSSSGILRAARACGADEIALHYALATRNRVATATESGLPVTVWTVDSSRWVDQAVRWGIHALITNNPAYMIIRRSELNVGEAN